MSARPVEVSLTVDGEAALYSAPGRLGKLRVANTGAYRITLDPRSGSPGPDNNHIALFLPAGTLSDASLEDLAVSDGWLLARGQRRSGENHWDGLFLLSGSARSIAPGEELVILLHGVAADANGTARHVRAVVEYTLLHDGPMVGAALRGSRSLVLHVVPWAHSPADMHLQAGVIRGSSVINRAEVANRVVVGLSATAVDGLVRFVGGRTELQLSWDIGPPDTHWWALCTGAEAEACEVAVEWAAVDWAAGAPSSVRPEVDRGVWVSETAATWQITVPADVAFQAGQGIALVVDGLVTSHPSGPANLYLTVSGVDDGKSAMFVLKVAKRPSIWSSTGGLTLYAGGDAELVTVRGEYGQPAAILGRSPSPNPSPSGSVTSPPGHRLDLYDGSGAVGARVSSTERSRLDRGLDVGDGVRLSGGVELTSQDKTLSISAGNGSLDLVAPTIGTTFTIKVEDDGRLHFAGSTTTEGTARVESSVVAGNSLVGGALVVNQQLELGGEFHATELYIYHGRELMLEHGMANDLVVAARGGLNVPGPLRMNNLPIAAVETFDYSVQFAAGSALPEAVLATGRRQADWTPLIIGEHQVVLTAHAPGSALLLWTETFNIAMVAIGGEWHAGIETPLAVLPWEIVGQGALTVLFLNNAALK